jgi:hypothetical protein
MCGASSSCPRTFAVMGVTSICPVSGAASPLKLKINISPPQGTPLSLPESFSRYNAGGNSQFQMPHLQESGLNWIHAGENFLGVLHGPRHSGRSNSPALVGARRNCPRRLSQLVDRLPQRLVLGFRLIMLESRDLFVDEACLRPGRHLSSASIFNRPFPSKAGLTPPCLTMIPRAHPRTTRPPERHPRRLAKSSQHRRRRSGHEQLRRASITRRDSL